MKAGNLDDRIRRIENEAAKVEQSRITRAIRIVGSADRADEAMSFAAEHGYDQPGDLVIVRSLVRPSGGQSKSFAPRLWP